MANGNKSALQFLFSFYRRRSSDSNFGVEIGSSGDADQTYLPTPPNQKKPKNPEMRFNNSEQIESYSLVLVAGFRAGLAGLNLGYPENPALKLRKP